MIASRPNGLVDYTIDGAIRRHVEMVLDYTGGDYAWACEELGVDRKTLYRWQRAWDAGAAPIVRPAPMVGRLKVMKQA